MPKLAIIQGKNKYEPDIARMCAELCPGLEIVGEAQRVTSGVKMIQTLRPELVIVSANLPDGSGFQVFEATTEIDYSKAVLNGSPKLRVRAARYQAKLFMKYETDFAVKFADLLQAGAKPQSVQHLYEAKVRWDRRFALDRLAIPVAEGMGTVVTDQVICIQDLGDRRVVTVQGMAEVVTSRRMGVLASALYGGTFFRLDALQIVNLRHVMHIDFTKHTGQVLLRHGVSLTTERAILTHLKTELDLWALGTGSCGA